MTQPNEKIENINIEIKLLIEAIYMKYGYDFRDYSPAHVRRRILHRFEQSGLPNISALQHKLLYDDNFVQQILQDLSINVTQMFRDPSFYKALRTDIIPLLKTYPFIKAWHAGCSTGEEVYSMAILLKEENLLQRTQLYATDFNRKVVNIAREGIYPVAQIKEYTQNYQQSGGINSFSDYYSAGYNSVILDPSLRKNIVFADHNLVTDSVFAEVNIIICRNVLIYFNRELQNRVLKLFYESLVPGGILCLGSRESIKFTAFADHFDEVNRSEKIYVKKYQS
jgi:chemotaxis protein methyltransferase CheR